MHWLFVILGIAANASASLLIKYAVTPPRQIHISLQPELLLKNWPVFLGLALYVATFLFYAAALHKLPLNVVHPTLTTGAVAAVAVLSAVVFNETLAWSTILGVALVIIGVVFISMRVV